MRDVQAETVVTTDGVIRNPQATERALGSDTWDGRRGSYIPVAPLRIDPSVQLHTEATLDIDPITYQVLRSRFWHKNLWSAFGATVADGVHVLQRPERIMLPAEATALEAPLRELETTGREVLAAEGFAQERIELGSLVTDL